MALLYMRTGIAGQLYSFHLNNHPSKGLLHHSSHRDGCIWVWNLCLLRVLLSLSRNRKGGGWIPWITCSQTPWSWRAIAHGSWRIVCWAPPGSVCPRTSWRM